MTEYLDLYTPDGHRTGFVQPRDETVLAGACYLVINVFTQDCRGNFLVTRRSPDKAFYPLCWEVTGGCVQAGESSRDGALRELREETGFVPSSLRFLGRLRCPTASGGAFFLLDAYAARLNDLTPAPRLQPGEVDNYRWLSPDQMEQLTRSAPMEPLCPLAWRRFRCAMKPFTPNREAGPAPEHTI